MDTIIKMLERLGKLSDMLSKEEKERIVTLYKKDYVQNDIDSTKARIANLQEKLSSLESVKDK